MKVKDYIVLEAGNAVDLGKRVSTYLKRGWELYEAPYGLVLGGEYHYQAMVLPLTNPREILELLQQQMLNETLRSRIDEEGKKPLITDPTPVDADKIVDWLQRKEKE